MKMFAVLKRTKYCFLYLMLLSFLLIKMVRGVYGVASSSGGVWNIIQIFFVFVGIIFFFTKYSSKIQVINGFLFFAIWIMFISMLNMVNHPIASLSSWFYYFMCPCAPLVLMIFYCLGQRNDIYVFSFLIKAIYYALILLFYFSMTTYRVASDSEEYIAFADIYYPMCLLPLVLLQTKPQRSIIPILAILTGVLVSGKRGGLVVVALVSFIYYFVGEKRRKRSQIVMIALFIGIVAASTYLINFIDANYGLHSIDRMMNSMEDGGSGRVSRWSRTMSTIGMSNIWELLFGHGFGAIYGLVGGRAHNDFIEVFYNYGFIAAILYIIFYVRLISLNVRQYRKKYHRAKYLTCSIIVALIMAIVSFFIVEPTYVLGSMFVTGLILGDWKKYENNGYKLTS